MDPFQKPIFNSHPFDLHIYDAMTKSKNNNISDDEDEDFRRNYGKVVRGELKSWPNINNDPRADPRNIRLEAEGPNINIKQPRRSYNSNEEKNYFFNKIKTKQKTELCKNWSLYSDCFFKDTCSFAHGERELRQSLSNTEKYKTKVCKMFKENFYCNYGNRCIYLHAIRDIRFYNYKNVLKKYCEECITELIKPENQDKEFCKLLTIVNSRKQYVV